MSYKSKKYLEDNSKKVNCMSYPHGSYNKETIKILKKLDYLNAHQAIKVSIPILQVSLNKKD